MFRTLPRCAGRLALFGVATSRALEQQAQARLAPHTLMRRAGIAVARLAIAIAPHAQRVWIAAGPGNNGGDGLQAAILLKHAGRDVRVALCGDATRLPPDASDALARAQAAGVAIGDTQASDFTRTLAPHDLAIDALLGLGASRMPQGPLAALIDGLNDLTCTVLAVDLPSGLDAHTGQALGGICVNARHTRSRC
ncbi:MAG: NAD(P)H-hydrate epimerase [Rhizobacter sp.]|nr:NAD(P)H-hydrate epimerase [Rhizobacter sp.]